MVEGHRIKINAFKCFHVNPFVNNVFSCENRRRLVNDY